LLAKYQFREFFPSVVTLAISTRKDELIAISNTYGYDGLRLAGFPLDESQHRLWIFYEYSMFVNKTMLMSQGNAQFFRGNDAQYRRYLANKVCSAHVCIIPKSVNSLKDVLRYTPSERRLFMYDLLIKGGRVIDPAQNIDDKLDIAISGGKIATVAKDIPSSESQRVVDASAKLVTPGLIDVHCHVFDSIHKISVEPDVAGVKQGVTTLGDGGSAGEATFAAFPKYIIPPSQTRIFCFLHLCSFGLIPEPELRDWDEVNLEAIATTIESHPDLIKGVKLRLVGNLVARDGVKVVETQKKIAKQFGLPIMIHIGDMDKQVSPTLTQEFLPLMEPGDILSHIYTGNFGNPLRPDGTVLPEMRAAMERGVIMDTAIGKNNLNFEVARKSLAQGL